MALLRDEIAFVKYDRILYVIVCASNDSTSVTVAFKSLFVRHFSIITTILLSKSHFLHALLPAALHTVEHV